MWDTDVMDLRPGYREQALGGGLDCAWVRVVGADDAPRRVLPDACVDLVWRAGGGAVLAGPDTGPVLVHAAPGSVLAGVRFGPAPAGRALRLPLEEVRDTRVAIAELWPELDRELSGELDPATALERLVRLARRLVAARAPDAAVREAARRLADPRTRVETLASDLGLSERQLRRRCRAGVGYGPKTLQRVLRFRRFLDLAGPGEELAGLAADAGYADQAHLTRESRRLTGLAPAALLRERQ